MLEIWITDGRYIQGKKLGKAADPKKAFEKAVLALKKAKLGDKFKRSKDKKTGEIWIDDAEGRPVGILVPLPEAK